MKCSQKARIVFVQEANIMIIYNLQYNVPGRQFSGQLPKVWPYPTSQQRGAIGNCFTI